MQPSPDVLHERLNGHARRIEVLEENQKAQLSELHAIQRNLTQIKWLAIGGGIVLTLQEFGIIEILQRLL